MDPSSVAVLRRGRKRRGFRRRDADGCDRDGRGPQRSGLQPVKRLAENSVGILFSPKWADGEGVRDCDGEIVGRVPWPGAPFVPRVGVPTRGGEMQKAE